MVMNEEIDILSHPGRKSKIHIITLDNVLACDVYERIHYDARMNIINWSGLKRHG
jgi:hypothetical protein